jgi:signal transduction histidine kinase
VHRRLLVVLVPLAVLLVAALGVPLGVTVAEREMQEVYVDRLHDIDRFASLAETALSTGRTEAIDQELTRYHELYGIPVAVLDTSGAVLLGPAAAYRKAARSEPGLARMVAAALAGARSEPSGEWAPWRESTLVVAEPVGRDGEVVGAVVTISDLAPAHDRILLRWAQLAGLGLLPLVALVAVAWPVSAWVLRPVRELDAATSRISRGDLTTRADAEAGPGELRRLAESFNTMMDAVENAAQRQRAFVSDASHQLRNPLTSLRLAVESLEPHLSGDGRPVFDVAVDELKAMQQMLNALQASARMESMRTASPVELDEVVATRLERWRMLGVTVEVPPGLRLLEPPGGLGSVLDELVSNALRLAEAAVIEVSAEAVPGGVVLIAVRDDGRGLDAAERAQALGRFWRSPRHQNVPGTGLGLAICADLIGAAGGELWLAEGLPRPDGSGHGFAAVIRLPAVP